MKEHLDILRATAVSLQAQILALTVAAHPQLEPDIADMRRVSDECIAKVTTPKAMQEVIDTCRDLLVQAQAEKVQADVTRERLRRLNEIYEAGGQVGSEEMAEALGVTHEQVLERIEELIEAGAPPEMFTMTSGPMKRPKPGTIV
jgi:hypothetical protein